MDIKIKKPKAKDFNLLRKSAGWPEILPLKNTKKAINNSLYCVTAYIGTKLVGMSRIIGDKGYAYYIQDVIVLPEYQNKGVGTEIMNKTMEYFEINKINQAMIGLLASKNKESFYKKFGFIVRPNDKLGSGMNIFRRNSRNGT